MNSNIVLRPASPGQMYPCSRLGIDNPTSYPQPPTIQLAEVAFEGADWPDELRGQDEYSEYLIAELNGQPIGAMQIIDPHLESTHYWGEIEPNLRAIDIWIGEPDCLGKGYGETMMRLALQRCFADPRVSAIVIDPLASNIRAHKFYRRMGFVPVGPRTFDEDKCLVHELKRQDWRAKFPDDEIGTPIAEA